MEIPNGIFTEIYKNIIGISLGYNHWDKNWDRITIGIIIGIIIGNIASGNQSKQTNGTPFSQ